MSLGFEHPFTCAIAGPTKSGKTYFVKQLLSALPFYVYPCPKRIVWAYGVKNEEQMKLLRNSSLIPLEFVEGIPDLDMFSSADENLLILDDLMKDAGKNSDIAEIFTKGCHHKNISVILILQNLFHQGSKMRDIHTSTNYLILFKNPRDKIQIKTLSHQVSPDNPKFLVDSYRKACKHPFSYIMFDFTQKTPDHWRVTSGIFPPEETFFVYRSDKK